MFKELRKQAKLTQTKIANKLGVKPQTVNMWERGKSTPDIKHIIPLADLFQTNERAILTCFVKD